MILLVVMLFAMLPTTVLADGDGKPDGWWPALDAYNQARTAYDQAAAQGKAGSNSQVEKDFLTAGDNYVQVLMSVSRNSFTAENLYNVYNDRRSRNIFENRNDYTAAADNIKKLMDISQWATDNGVHDYTDMVLTCRARLSVLEPRTGVYALSYTQKNTYGSKIAASSGTYYGAVETSENYDQRTITSFYVELEERSIADHAYRIDTYADGSRVLQINLNFKNEGTTAKKVPSGAYDSLLQDGLSYLATVNSPVLLRIGAEMDNWRDRATPQEFIAAYRYIAAKARSLCPKAELVWSPNYVADFYTSAESYYPGDDVVDWVGVSLYYNYASTNNSAAWIEFAKKYQYADPVLVAMSVMDIAVSHKKPFIVTEGGAIRDAAHDGTGIQWTAKKAAKEYSTLNMVYPQVKAIVYFDTVNPSGTNDYRIQGQVKTAVDQAIAENPAMIQPGTASAGTWIPITGYKEKPGDILLIGAAGHTFKNADMSAVYKLDGSKAASTGGSPNYLKLNMSALRTGKHKLEVTLSDGYGYSAAKTYTLLVTGDGAVQISEGWTDGGYTATPFSDVPDSAYYVDAVNWAYYHEPQITDGTGHGKFSPEAPVDRGQTVTFLWRAAGKPEPQTKVNPFKDVKETDYFYKAVLWAVEKGITNGTNRDGTKFSPKDPVKRNQLVTFLWRSLDRPGDTGSSVWYEDAERWANENGLLTGTAVAYQGKDNCPRQDVVLYLYRALENK